jgi:hypothetical protein
MSDDGKLVIGVLKKIQIMIDELHATELTLICGHTQLDACCASLRES